MKKKLTLKDLKNIKGGREKVSETHWEREPNDGSGKTYDDSKRVTTVR